MQLLKSVLILKH